MILVLVKVLYDYSVLLIYIATLDVPLILPNKILLTNSCIIIIVNKLNVHIL